MIIPVQITFRGLDHSAAVEAYARKRAAKLEVFGHVMRCRVLVEAAHRHHKHGKRYHVRIDLTVRGRELVVSRNPPNIEHEDVYACIDAAFDDAGRILQDFVRQHRQDVKHHDASPEGRVVELARSGDHGFLESDEGERLYFHRNAVLGDAFDRLYIGSRVRFAREQGRKGPQASTVEQRDDRQGL